MNRDLQTILLRDNPWLADPERLPEWLAHRLPEPVLPRDVAPTVRERWAEANRIVHDIVLGFGGSISAEHGIGRLKREELARTAPPLKLELMRRLKAALDPDGIMNPGKVI